MAMVTGLVLMFAFTAGGVIWLARDVDRSVSNRGSAQSIAFQAARSGAQQVSADSLRSGQVVTIDAAAAEREARRTAADLFEGYDVVGRVDHVDVEAATVVVKVTIFDTAGDVTGVAAARAETGP
jgi:predicted kinase